MPVNWPVFRAGVREVINIVWPEVTAADGGYIWTRAAIERVALEDLNDDEDAVVATAIVQPRTQRLSRDWSGLTNQAYELETLIHYLRRRDNTATDWEEYVEAKLSALSVYLLYTPLPALVQCPEVREIDAREDNEVNRVLLDKGKAWYGGTLTALLLTGHSARE